ncbi:hypothetical protein F5Y14DRAFT_310929 [Nemania sp. NC0429]|nr:hypothetical protein F5Y14DRAFT_310929 [Nemania sp. NC0429]
MDSSFQAIVQRHNTQMDFAFRSLVDILVRNSKLSISLLRISNVTEDSFHVSLEARITKTGPASASIEPMKLDLCGPAGRFGKVTLPAITTQAYGTDVTVTSQLVNIVDKEALRVFIRAIIEGDDATLSLRNGRTRISALGVGPREFTYEKEIGLPGMKGPLVSVHAASVVVQGSAQVMAGSPSTASLAPSGVVPPLTSSRTAGSIWSIAGLGGGRNAVSVVLRVTNPSPMEISFGTCSFDIQNHEGAILAELKGRLDIRRNYFEATFHGSVNKAVAAKLADDMREAAAAAARSRSRSQDGDLSPRARLVGKRCAGAGWCDETIKGIDVPLQNVDRLFRALNLVDGVEELDEKRTNSLSRWTQRLMMR